MKTLAEVGFEQEYLTAEREALLIAKMRANCQRSRDALVMSHVRIVTAYAAKYKAHHDFDSLMSAGLIGLMIACEKFNPDRGARFATACTWYVKGEMFKLMQKDSNVANYPETSATKRAFFGLVKAKRRLGIVGDPTDAEILALAADLEVTEEDVHVTLARKRAVASLNAPMRSHNSDTEFEMLDFLADETLVPADDALVAAEESQATLDTVADALATLSPNERYAVERRVLTDTPDTLDALAKEKGRSRERLRQWQARGLEKISDHVRGVTPKPKPVRKPKPITTSTRKKRRERLAFVVRRCRWRPELNMRSGRPTPWLYPAAP